MEHIIKSDFMLKRSQMKGQFFYKENYNERWFELTQSSLRYKDGTRESGANKLKGSVALNTILSVEQADPSILGNRSGAFQIHYKVFDSLVGELRTLYVIAFYNDQRDDWIAAIRKAAIDAGGLKGQKFHTGLWAGKAYSCCGHVNRRDEGCQLVSSSKETGSSCSLDKKNNFGLVNQSKHSDLHEKYVKPLPLLPDSNSNESQSPMPTPIPKPRQRALNPVVDTTPQQEKVIALYDYFAIAKGHIDLIQGEEYTVIEELYNPDDPVIVKSIEGMIGLAPRNYIQFITGNINDLKLFDWFYSNTSKVQAENILSEDSREGCFIVRESAKNDYLYALSVLTRKAKNIDKLEEPYITKHYHIKTDVNGNFFLNEKHLFDNVPQLIYYHKRNCAGLTVRLKCHPRDKIKPPPLLDLIEISPNDLDIKSDLGSGQFGKVEMAILNKKYQVAVKTVKPGMMSEIDFLDEAHNMAKLHHPNLVKLLGVCKNPLMIIVEYMKHGSLVQYLKRNDASFARKPESLLNICFQVCEGMKYLEEKKLIHRDLAARNCLVGEGQIIKVCDFGLARYVPDDEYLSSFGSKFPFRWASPEVMHFNTFSSKSDVWSFGILMWEVYTCGNLLPYHQQKTNPEVDEFVTKKKGRPEQPSYCSNPIYKVMLMCWEQDPDNRPSFAKLTTLLNNITNDFS